MSFKKTISGKKPDFMLSGKLGDPIAKVKFFEETNEGIKFEIEPIHPMTKEKLETGMRNIMKALSE